VTKPQTILDNQTGVASMKVLLVFNKLSDFKDKIYQSFLEKLGEKAHVDVYVHQVTPLSTQHFDQVIREELPNTIMWLCCCIRLIFMKMF
jgi:hypothetical protein